MRCLGITNSSGQHGIQSFFWGIGVTVLVAILYYAGISLATLACHAWHPHLSPMARCGRQSQTFMKSYEAFKGELELWITQQEQSGFIDEAAVYFRDLQNGPWFGIREDETFLPASLFKLPVMIAVLKAIERKPSLATEELGITALPNLDRDTNDPERTVIVGRYYKIDELLERMIVYSDNISMELLERRLVSLGSDGISVHDLYRDLGLLPAEDAQTVSVQSYSSLFRILYYARYLTRESSEEALALLARSDFKNGIVAGVPLDIHVAHKFGIHNHDLGRRLFHDCGIVYHPQRPYMLCIMTSGDSLENSVRFIAELSHKVYNQVQQNIRTEW